MDTAQIQQLNESMKGLMLAIQDQSAFMRDSKNKKSQGQDLFGGKNRRTSPKKTDHERKVENINKRHSIYLKDMSQYLKNINRTADKEEKSKLQVLRADKQYREVFDKIAENTRTAKKELDALPSVFENVLKKSGLKAGMFGGLKRLEDIDKVTDSIGAFERSAEFLEQMSSKQKKELTETAKKFANLNQHLKDAGESFKGFENLDDMIADSATRREIKKAFSVHGDQLNDLYSSLEKTEDGFETLAGNSSAAIPKFRDNVDKLSKAVDRATKTVGGTKLQRARGILSSDRKGSRGTGAASLAGEIMPMLKKAGILGMIGGAVASIAKENLPKWIDERREVLRYGAGTLNEGMGNLGLGQTGTNAIDLGMNPQEMAKMIGQNKQLFHRMNLQGKSYVDTLKGATDQLVDMGVPLQESTIANSRNADYVHSLGVAAVDTAAEIEKQNQKFQEFRKFGFATPEEYQNFRDGIMMSGEVQSLMSDVREDERIALEANIMKMAEYGKTLGFTNEQAKDLATRFAKMSKEAPMERIKEGAKMAMFASQMGTMNAEELRKYMRITTLGSRNAEEADFVAKQDMEAIAKYKKMKANDTTGATLPYEQFFTTMMQKYESLGVAGQMGAGKAITPEDAAAAQAAEIETQQKNSGMAQIISMWDGFIKSTQTSLGTAGTIAVLVTQTNRILENTLTFLQEGFWGKFKANLKGWWDGISSWLKSDDPQSSVPAGAETDYGEDVGTPGSPYQNEAEKKKADERRRKNTEENKKKEAKKAWWAAMRAQGYHEGEAGAPISFEDWNSGAGGGPASPAPRPSPSVEIPTDLGPAGASTDGTPGEINWDELASATNRQTEILEGIYKNDQEQLRSSQEVAFATGDMAKTGKDAYTSTRIYDMRTNADLTTAAA